MPPFNNCVPTAVAVNILAGRRPERPTHPNLTEDVWDLTQRCWNQNPKQRPEISEIIFCLQSIHNPQNVDDTTLDGSTLGKLFPTLTSLQGDTDWVRKGRALSHLFLRLRPKRFSDAGLPILRAHHR